ncbi:hypothetical protein JB92DRAFT_2742745 [Gautieria morchelliformis]|nr:hypothetical protein JB92DRAFT_2742745 [Gautieria morchelliformis]
MSNFFLDCTISLSGGNCESSVVPASGNWTWHCYYSTAIECTILPVNISIYSLMNDVVHPNLAVGHVIGRAVKLSDGPMFLDAYLLMPFPSDPTSSGYEDHLPQAMTAYVWVLRTVMTALEKMPDDKSWSFNPIVLDFVCDSMKYSTVQ